MQIGQFNIIENEEGEGGSEVSSLKNPHCRVKN